MYHYFFIHSSVNGHLDCFHIVAIVISASVKNGIHVSFSILVSSGYMHRSLITASLAAQMVKHLPTMWETWVQSLSGEDLLKKEIATHCSILAWKIPWMEEPCRLQFMGSQELDTTVWLHFLFFTFSFLFWEIYKFFKVYYIASGFPTFLLYLFVT